MKIEQLTKIVGKELADKYFIPITEVFKKYCLDTPLRQAHFLGQTCHESNGLRVMAENLNYTASGLLATFPKYFTYSQANEYAKKPEKIANRVYANRMGNGNEASGDGWKFRGHGAIQLTGHDNHAAFSKDTGMDVMSNPGQIATDPHLSIMAAGWFWNKRSLNALADKDDILAITKAINGGVVGLISRKEWTAKAKAALNL